MYDVVIAGGGPAGLSAALVLGRCRRSVLLCDDGRYRNAASHGLHGYLTRDCIHPAEFLAAAREQLRAYSVEYRCIRVEDAAAESGSFRIVLSGGETVRSRKLLLATGVVDRLPNIEGIEAFYGTSVFHCPYCDGWEMRDQPLAVYGRGHKVHGLALSLLSWSRDLVVVTDGPPCLSAGQRAELARHSIGLRPERIAGLEGSGGTLQRILFTNAEPLVRRAIFFNTGQDQRCDLVRRLGCNMTSKGAVRTGSREETNIPGLYVAGDASRDVQLAIVAAAEGAKAAVAIHTALQREYLHGNSSKL